MAVSRQNRLTHKIRGFITFCKYEDYSCFGLRNSKSRRVLGRAPKDFSAHATETAATGIWSN
ncbi:hypothetical protein EN805_15555 [bacterium M00.F.Ca.ET.162.01.1.1]|nr:hypothetical protein EN848_20275 [bacterium M00.F.Ca.ET.205.01.1.1]TGU52069.1 hypothetical protein EN795_19825 [bacterium M00.F.Ca.ET.152.01.1.1]TGZ42609.1 hypothetical protein EN805_15555 [bacterium M00.F.Ca.ET.162.01.1.1]